VRLLRICLLVLIAVLLPMRGAMATAALCPLQADASAHHGYEMASGHHHAGDEAGSSQHHQDKHDKHDDGSGHDKCSLCASCCSALPVPSSFASLPEPFGLAQSFPDLRAPAPSFLSDGQERPPRSI